MIKSVTVTNYIGDTVKIVLTEDNPSHGLLIVGMDGLGPAKASINMTDFAAVDGGFYNSARLESRNIVLHLKFAGMIEESRQNTYKFFPIKKNVTLLIETDRRKLQTTGYVESNEPNIFDEQEGCDISIVCPDSYFYEGTGDQINSFFGITPLFEFPFSYEFLSVIETVQDSENDDVLDSQNDTVQGLKYQIYSHIEFGELESSAFHNVYYKGDAQTGIEITIHLLGAVSGAITIANSLTNEIMQINVAKIESIIGDVVAAGDDIIVNTERGNKTARFLRNGRYYNVLGAIAWGSDWLQLVKGDNLFAYGVTSGLENLQLTFRNKIVYEGV